MQQRILVFGEDGNELHNEVLITYDNKVFEDGKEQRL